MLLSLKAPWKNSLEPSLQGSQQSYQVNENGHFLAGTRTSDIWGTSDREEFTQICRDHRQVRWQVVGMVS